MDIAKIEADIKAYKNEVDALERIKLCSDVGPFAEKYINRNIDVIKRHICDLESKLPENEIDKTTVR